MRLCHLCSPQEETIIHYKKAVDHDGKCIEGTKMYTCQLNQWIVCLGVSHLHVP